MIGTIFSTVLKVIKHFLEFGYFNFSYLHSDLRENSSKTFPNFLLVLFCLLQQKYEKALQE